MISIFANIRFTLEYEKAIEAKQVAQQQVETQRQILAQREIEAQQKVATAKGEAKSILVVAQGQAKANDTLSRSISFYPRSGVRVLKNGMEFYHRFPGEDSSH